MAEPSDLLTFPPPINGEPVQADPVGMDLRGDGGGVVLGGLRPVVRSVDPAEQEIQADPGSDQP